jgi:hypothetical protein
VIQDCGEDLDQYQESETFLVSYRRAEKDDQDLSVNYKDASEKIDLMNVKQVLFKFLMYQEQTMHTIKFRFEYSFTQN